MKFSALLNVVYPYQLMHLWVREDTGLKPVSRNYYPEDIDEMLANYYYVESVEARNTEGDNVLDVVLYK